MIRMSITSETRREAYYESLETAKNRRDEIYLLLNRYGPMTSEEIMDCLGCTNPNCVRPRLSELKEAGLIEACGKKLAKCGKVHIAVWKVAEIERAAPDGANIEDGKAI